MKVEEARARFIKNVSKGLNREKNKFERRTGLIIKDIGFEVFQHYSSKDGNRVLLDKSIISDVNIITNIDCDN